MEENKYIKEALSKMARAGAYENAVRHRYDLGLSLQEIQNNLTYPVSMEKIQHVIEEIEHEKQEPNSEYEYIQKTDEYGRKSFVRVLKEQK